MSENLHPGLDNKLDNERAEKIISILKSHGIYTLDAKDLVGRPEEVQQLKVVAHIKELPGDVEAIGIECFGNKWQEEIWI